MNITDVRIRKVDKPGKLRGVASVTFDNEFVIHDIKVIDGDKGLFIAMPSKKSADGEYRDIAHPINSDARGRIQTAILDAYEKAADEDVPGEQAYAGALPEENGSPMHSEGKNSGFFGGLFG